MIPGIHVSTTGGLDKSPARLRELGMKAGQIFTANQRRWVSSPLRDKTVDRFRAETGDLLFVAHASYLINPASSREDVVEKSAVALDDEYSRCVLLGIPYIVLHPGAFQKNGLEKGLEMIAGALDHLFHKHDDGPLILLENTAGAGTTVGRKLEELKAIRDLSSSPERIGYCIDTAHAHGAGYDVGSGRFPGELESVLRAELIKVFHLNGSKVETGSNRDRHEHFDAGFIGIDGIRKLFNSSVFEHSLGIAETPGTDNDRATDIRLLERKEMT